MKVDKPRHTFIVKRISSDRNRLNNVTLLASDWKVTIVPLVMHVKVKVEIVTNKINGTKFEELQILFCMFFFIIFIKKVDF